jgi:hypothetical protein
LKAVLLKFIGAVVAGAAFAGMLTWLSATTSAWPVAGTLPKPGEASLKPAPDRVGSISTALVPNRTESPTFRLLTNDALTPSAGMFSASVSDARLLLESSQIQDW